MAAGQASHVPSGKALSVRPPSGPGVSALLGAVGAVFSFFFIGDVEFLVIALPLVLAGLATGLVHLHRVKAGRAADRAAGALGITLSALGIGFCAAGVILASLS